MSVAGTFLFSNMRRRAGVVFVAAMACLAGTGICARGQTASAASAPMHASGDAMGGMAHMAGHMFLTALRPPNPGDRQKADAVAAAAKEAMAPYQDYKKALADGYEIFLPNVPQPIYHFTKYEYGREARQKFDATKPTSLLYKKTVDGYKLVGAMYTDSVDASEEELNERVPLSVARWHQHINFCKAPDGQKAGYFGPDAKFGLMGSITTKEACDAAGGEFRPHLFGWMVHVYPYETDPAKVWAVDDDEGHDSMQHSAMPGMGMK
jgi:hypothetical protein